MRWLWPLLALGCGEPHFDGPPELEVGTGQYEFEPVEDGQYLPFVEGPQGGEHVWVALRTWNLDPREVHVVTDLTFVETGEVAGDPLYFDISMFRDPDGGHWYAGLPRQLVVEDVNQRLVEIDVQVTDRWDRVATDWMQVVPRHLVR